MQDSTFEFTLTVTDNENAQDTDSVEVQVESPSLPHNQINQYRFEGI
jgi:hypothetical protein